MAVGCDKGRALLLGEVSRRKGVECRFGRVKSAGIPSPKSVYRGLRCDNGSARLAFTSPSEKLVWRSFTFGNLKSVSIDQRE
jgi:hypothetical protein